MTKKLHLLLSLLLLMLCVGAKADEVTFDATKGDNPKEPPYSSMTKDPITFSISSGNMLSTSYYSVNTNGTATFESAAGYKITKIVFGEYRNRRPSNFKCDQDGYDGIIHGQMKMAQRRLFLQPLAQASDLSV